MVRLGDGIVRPDRADNSGFQFHYGSIGSAKKTFVNMLKVGFQFHYGSIGRLLPRVYPAPS